MAEVCRLILNRDKFNSNEIDGKAALLYAAEYGYPRVIREVSFKGLDLDLTDNEGRTAVFYAKQNRNMVALCDLIVGGVEFDMNRIDGKAAFLMLLRKT